MPCHRHLRSSSAFSLLGPCALALLGSSAHASLLLWNSPVGGSAATAANWSPAQVPAAADDLQFSLGAAYSTTFNATVNASNTHTYRAGTVTLTMTTPHTAAAGMTIGDLNGDSATAILTTGEFNVSGPVIVGDAAGSAGTLTVNDDDADFIVANGADLTIGNNGDATLNITGIGRVEVADQLIVGSNATSSPQVTISGFQVAPIGASSLVVLGTSQSRIGQGGDATMTISDGAAATFAGDVVIANGSASNTSVTIEEQGLLNARMNVAGDLFLGRNTSATAAGVGTLNVNDGGTLDVGGTLFVGGDVAGGEGTLHLTNGGDAQLGGMQVGLEGNVILSGGTLNSATAIVNDAAGAITGNGTINADIDNAGTITPTGAAGLTINGVLNNTTENQILGTQIHFGPKGGYTGSGTVAAEISGDAASAITATGTLSLGANTTAGFSFNGDLNVGGNIVTLVDSNGAVLGGETTIDSGRIECPTGIGVQNGAAIRGDGLLVGNLICPGILDPETSNGSVGGLITIQGDAHMNPTGQVHMTIKGHPQGGTSYDRIVASGAATFDGTVHLTLAPGLVLHPGEQFILFNAVQGHAGEFDSIIAPETCNGVTFVLVYSSTAAIVLVRPPDADVTRDDEIDVDDLVAVIVGWGDCAGPLPPCTSADVTNDSEVDVDDLIAVILHWGACP
jgi:T5SS/PEP-CTERM-associated repeat protein